MRTCSLQGCNSRYFSGGERVTDVIFFFQINSSEIMQFSTINYQIDQWESGLFCVESFAFIRCLFAAVLHFGDPGSELHGSLGQDGRGPQAQLSGCQPEQQLLPQPPGQGQVSLLPHWQLVQQTHYILVQVWKSLKNKRFKKTDSCKRAALKWDC